MNKRKMKAAGILSVAACVILSAVFSFLLGTSPVTRDRKISDHSEDIKWVDFDIPYDVMKKAMDIDIESYDEKIHINWTDILAYMGARYGGDFSRYAEKDMDSFTEALRKGIKLSDITGDMKYYPYYSRAYDAVLGGFLGEYQLEIPDSDGRMSWKKAYGLKAFSPLAEGFCYSDFDDFGQNRSYGYSRQHLGHDLLTSSGTPVISVESGIVEAMGWNQYGGWRLGIRSFDKKRYYYYAHLQKDHPFADGLYTGAAVKAGDILGYTGQTGYSLRENTNNIDTPHLHFGMQLVFDEDAKDSDTQIWIDLYDITRLLSAHRCSVERDDKTGDYRRKYRFAEENPYLREIQASAGTSGRGKVRLPVVMYHSILKKPVKESKYVVSPDLLEKDLKYLKKKGYTPVFMKDVIAYEEGKGTLPAKPIVLSFDDGYYNNYYYAFPLLRKYDMKAVISIVGRMTDEFSENEDTNPNYSHVTWDDVLEMHLSGNWEIQNHSYDCHSYDTRNGISQKKTESNSQYRKFLTGDISRLQEQIAYVTGVAPNTFTYPFGAFSKNTDDILRKAGFKATLSCTEGVSTIKKGDPDSLYMIKRHLRPPDKSPEEFFDFL